MMKASRCALVLAILFLVVAAEQVQAQKILKDLKKSDKYYNAGSYDKAVKYLNRFKSKSTAKLGAANPYLPDYYLREARIALARGVFTGFEKSLEDALSASRAGEDNVLTQANTLIGVAEIYNEYGNYRLSRQYIEQATKLLETSTQMTDVLKARIGLVEAEAMIGQGFCNDALAILNELEPYFAKRAVEKETYVEGSAIKSRRVPEEELPLRYGDYAKLLALRILAYGTKGRVSIAGDNEIADVAYANMKDWMRGKTKYLGETNTIDVYFRYIYKNIRTEQRGVIPDPDLQLGRILNDLKKKVNPTNGLAHDIYLAYLEELFKEDNRARYLNTKLEYQKVLDKYFPKNSVHRINMQAVEFNARIAREKTKDLENVANGVLASKTLPKYYTTNIRILEFLYEIAVAEKRLANAENYLNQLVDIKKELCGENSPVYHLARVDLANFYIDYTNKFDEAAKIYQESYTNVLTKEIGEQHKNLIEILNHLANLYELKDNYAKATQTLKDARSAAVFIYSSEDILYGMELNNIAKLEIKVGNYEGAGEDVEKALKVIDLKKNRDYVEYTPSYIDALETQARLYGIKGLFDEAERTLSSKIIRKSKGPATDLSKDEELSSLYIQLGRYSETDRILDQVISEYEQLYGRNSLRLIEPLVNKGRILLARGEYTDADRVARRAYDLARAVYGETSTKTALTQKLLGDIEYALGDYDKAEDNLTRAIASQEKQFGRNHIEVAKSLSQLALIKFHKGDRKDAVEKLMLEAKTTMAEKLGTDNPQYAEILKNVAVLYISQKKYDIAFNSLTVAEGIWRAKTGTKNNINLASIYTLTGDVYYQLKNYKKAEDFYNQSAKLYSGYFSKKHPEYVKIRSKLAKVYYMQKNYKDAKSYIEESLGNYEDFIKVYFAALSEGEKAKYWNTIKGDFEFYNTLAFSPLEEFKDLTDRVYNYQLLTKALLLSSSIKIRERILNSTDEQLKEQYNNWVEKKERLTLALSMSPEQLTENEIDPNALQQEVERLERDLSQKSELFGQSVENKRITYEDVKKSLKENEVAIEMVRYRLFDHSFTDSVIYAVMYIKKDMSKPKVILLKDGYRMETRFFKYYRNTITGKIPDNVSYGAFWAPIYREIGIASTIYLSPDGVYNQINLEAIPTPDGKYVIDNSNIVLVSNTKDLYLKKVKTSLSPPTNTALMFGNPTFYIASAGNIPPLPGTEKEVEQLQFLLKQKGYTTTEYVEKAATEEKVKEINSPKIFHIATHGFSKPTSDVTLEEEIEGNEAMLTQNPLMRTGLLLRGAGDLLAKTDYNYNMDSGILTAYEAMSLNLDKTDLVVLSACETGLGEVEQGEGVVGLSRAFLVAGAKVLIMSMFKVDDEATQKLMIKFYQKWTNSGNLRQSFVEAKKELRADYPEPIYWGAFMMIGLE